MRKPAFCICENKDADQLRGNREADHRLCFRYTDSTIPLLHFKPLTIFCGCTARFVLDLVGNPEDRFSQNEAHTIVTASKLYLFKKSISIFGGSWWYEPKWVACFAQNRSWVLASTHSLCFRAKVRK